MKKALVVIDMQNDFITGPLGNDECRNIVENVVNKVKNFDGDIYFTQDSHEENYLETQEGKNLPVKHCILGSDGWQIIPELKPYLDYSIRKETFGSTDLARIISGRKYDEVELIGVCTGICVISNAFVIKAFNPEVKITVDAACCACVTPETHKTALEAMKLCQVEVINE
jgi:nicotinamidase-related amidase